ncbi:Pheophytinase, chloroplastic [Porphyridium purpureum]|uniref:Pheophytinase, chloroplastic n=1 Tax=Porphyridium purpureum TaxID=35688 RepID=A0A5J4Z3Z6_PORPP|nr:Pheophytinase, chloroplastic [Porphyridium purpureum]|eukprot:POR7173..scf295_1
MEHCAFTVLLPVSLEEGRRAIPCPPKHVSLCARRFPRRSVKALVACQAQRCVTTPGRFHWNEYGRKSGNLELDPQIVHYETSVHDGRTDAHQQEGVPRVLLIHGFGANTTCWRATVPALTCAGYEVVAVDLLGFGQSDKPVGPVPYSIELWAQLVLDLVAYLDQERPNHGWVLAGNSIGSLTALQAATYVLCDGQDASSQPNVTSSSIWIRGLVLFNCAGGLVSFRSEDLSAPLAFLWKTFRGALFNDVVGNLFFERFRSPSNIRSVLLQVYRNHTRVDDELVSSIFMPSEHPNASRVFLQVLNAEAGPRPSDLLRALDAAEQKVPICVIWGSEDPWTPLVGGFFPGEKYPEWNSRLELSVVPNCGHLPMDDDPETVNPLMLSWFAKQFAMK